MLWQNIFISIILEIESVMRDGDMRRSLVAGTIAENLPPGQTSYQWQVGKTLTGWVNPGADFKLRVSSIVPPTTSGPTYYFYDSGGKLLSEYDQNGTCVKDYLYLGGKMIGEFIPSSGSYYYYASDQINSMRLVTDSTGAVVHSAQYDPFGGLYKTWIDTWHPKPGFSGKERELYSDLDYFGARYYGHKQYRFLSVDPVINKAEALTNPQLWNLYTYCSNSPISQFDSDGSWSEPIHNQIIDAAFPSKKLDHIRNIFKEASAYVDTDQSMAKSYMHAMSAPWQTPADAEKQMGKFLSEMKTQYRNFMSKGKKYEAYFALGMAMHALMDSTSPSHAGFQQWGDLNLFFPTLNQGTQLMGSGIKMIAHSLRENDLITKTNPEYITKSAEQIRSFYNESK
jgi:RHS repeat-associated protein